MKLDQLALSQELADSNVPVLLVRAYEVPDEEVARIHFFQFKLRVHGDSQEQVVSHQVLVLWRESTEHVLQVIQRSLAVQFDQQVAFRLGDALQLTDGTAALRHHCLNHDVARQGYAHYAVMVDLVAQEQCVSTRSSTSAGQPTHLHGRWECVVQPGKEAFASHGKRVHQYQEARLLFRRYTQQR